METIKPILNNFINNINDFCSSFPTSSLNIIELGPDILFRIMFLAFKYAALNVKDVNYISIHLFRYGLPSNINGRSVNSF